jgi:hypothetical protein
MSLDEQPPSVFVAYVLGDGSDITDEIIAESAQIAVQAAELELDDYFGKGIRWDEPLTERSLFYQTGSFHEHAHTIRTVVVCERKVWTQTDIDVQKTVRHG